MKPSMPLNSLLGTAQGQPWYGIPGEEWVMGLARGLNSSSLVVLGFGAEEYEVLYPMKWPYTVSVKDF